MEREQLKALIKRSLKEDNLSSEEYERLLQAIYALEENGQEDLLQEIFEEIEEEPFYRQIPSVDMLQVIQQDPRMQADGFTMEKAESKTLIHWRRPLAWVASVLVVFSLGFYAWKTDLFQQFITGNATTYRKIRITHGKQQALLVLPTGDEIALDSLADGRVITVGEMEVSMKDGLIHYDGLEETEIATNTIRTPIGGDYQATLPDGTQVWLNAGSSLTYPLAFTEATREVKMEGEVFFDVAKDKKHPFIVRTMSSSIKVLGTQFNVSAYADDKVSKTTLIEGGIAFEHQGERKVLKPGDQASVRQGEAGVQVQAVDVEEAMAWKNGYFYFNNEDLSSAMQKIARWYDVEVVYKGAVSQKKLDGTISRMADIQELLKLLNLTGTAHFSIKERRIEVKI